MNIKMVVNKIVVSVFFGGDDLVFQLSLIGLKILGGVGFKGVENIDKGCIY